MRGFPIRSGYGLAQEALSVELNQARVMFRRRSLAFIKQRAKTAGSLQMSNMVLRAKRARFLLEREPV
jgi:hypothetical protein